jgi:2-polyprenyl-6-methoxyphenol hydroxylase-like FAD-dependent oxidoreductase
MSNITIVGGGLVGSLLAISGQGGHTVVFERRGISQDGRVRRTGINCGLAPRVDVPRRSGKAVKRSWYPCTHA